MTFYNNMLHAYEPAVSPRDIVIYVCCERRLDCVNLIKWKKIFTTSADNYGHVRTYRGQILFLFQVKIYFNIIL